MYFIKSIAELSQDVASKGLGLVYELGNEQDQQELVTTLVDTLMTGKRYSELRTSRLCKYSALVHPWQDTEIHFLCKRRSVFWSGGSQLTSAPYMYRSE